MPITGIVEHCLLTGTKTTNLHCEMFPALRVASGGRLWVWQWVWLWVWREVHCVCWLLPTAAARFIVHVRSNGVILLQNNHDRHNYLALKNNTVCIVSVSKRSSTHVFMLTSPIPVCLCNVDLSVHHCRVEEGHTVNSTFRPPSTVSAADCAVKLIIGLNVSRGSCVV